jgi:type II secretory pathway component PulK
MKLPVSARGATFSEQGSLLIIVLWMALGLVTITLYFASSMSFELRASENRVSGMAADQAIEAGCRYVTSVLSLLATNGAVPDVSSYQREAVPVGDSHFWLIGRPVDYQVQPDEVFFGLVDEGSRLNLNIATADMFNLLTNMTPELAANIIDWRNTNGNISANGDGPQVYSQIQPSYQCKNAPYETIDELRLVYPTDLGTLVGEDYNRNGVLDLSESDTNRNGVVDPGLLEFVTVYSREPNTLSDGSRRIDISNLNNSSSELTALLQTNLAAGRATQVMRNLGVGATGPARPGQPPATTVATTFASPLGFYLRSGMTSDEFASIAQHLTVTNGTYITGRVNINTATAAVLCCLPGLSAELAQQILSYRQQNPDKLTSIAWIVDALGANNAALRTLAAGDYITTQSYQFTADIAALGPHGRGYRRVKFVFDTTSGTPQIIYRQDLSHLGWALGKNVRQNFLIARSQ